VTISTFCKSCGREFEVSHDRIVAGPHWKYCPDCEAERTRPQYDVGGRCQKCRKPMRDPRRFICLTCAGLS